MFKSSPKNFFLKEIEKKKWNIWECIFFKMDLQNNLIIWQTCGKVVMVLWYVGLYSLALGR
jgi:hypothetical protein